MNGFLLDFLSHHNFFRNQKLKLLMKNCPNCGHQNPDDAKFCETCGTALTTVIQPQPQYHPPTGAVVSEGQKIGLGILSFLIPLVGIILGITYMNDSNP